MKKIGLYILLFVGFFLLFSSYKQEQDKRSQTLEETNGISLEATPRSNFSLGNVVSINIKNSGESSIVLPEGNNPPFEVEYEDQILEYPEVEVERFWPSEIEPNSNFDFSFDRWNNEIFDKPGEYEISLNSSSLPEDTEASVDITIKEKGFFGFVWETVLYRPMYNILLFITTSIPGNSLGWGIIILTFLIRLVLLIPNQRALESQKKLQEVQPKLQELQKKYADDKAKLSQETMALWKKHKVNPFGSCLPILIQLPILIALYYVIRDGLLYSKTRLLYYPLQDIDLETIDTLFLGILPLDVPNRIFIPIVLIALQFLQLYLANSKRPPMPEGQPDLMKTMMYIMPLIIGFISATFPAGLSLYWGVSTLFGIFQQIVVNKEKKTQMG